MGKATDGGGRDAAYRSSPRGAGRRGCENGTPMARRLTHIEEERLTVVVVLRRRQRRSKRPGQRKVRLGRSA